ncbi:MAG: tetratricopeptide repeat protein [Gammaproteobacteria bacterium]|nr:tetratricopeptide repeat protein [Gammaproteobacteria bacterium]
MKLVMLVTSISLCGGLWPFGGGEKEYDEKDTIADLKPRPMEMKRQPDVADGAALARQQYEAFLGVSDGYPGMQLEAMRRLADLNLAAGEEAGMEGLDDAQFYADAIKLYEQLLIANPDAAERDLILYQLARAHEITGEIDAALGILDDLVTNYPASKFYDEAQFRRGEILFVNKRYREAEAAYAAVITFGSVSSFYEQSLYKHGWSLFKQGLHDESLDSFLALLDARLDVEAGPAAALEAMSRPDRELVDDTFRVLAISFWYMDGADSLDELLARRADLAYPDLLYAGLGDLYLDKERFQDAAETYAAFVVMRPTHEAAPGLQKRVIEAYTLGRFPSLVLEAKEDYVRFYGLDAGFWAGRQPANYPEVVANLKESLSDLAGYDHSRAQADDDVEAYERAADWYRRYLAYFPEDPDSAQRSFLLAEILNELGRYGEATDQYLDAAYAYGPHPQAAEAAYAAILVARQHEAQLGPELLPAWRARTLEESLRFADSFPQHEQAGPVRTKVAEELFEGGQLARAVEIAGLVVTMQPPVAMELERTAWTVMAHAQFDLANYAESEQAYLRLRMLPLEGEAIAAEIDARIAASVYRQGEQARDAGDIDTAVAQFLRVGAAAPGTETVPVAVYDAAALLISAGRYQEAVPVLEEYRNTFPGHEFNDDVTQKLAVARRESGQTVAAAMEYERVASLASVDNEMHREALWEAVELYEAADRIADQRRVYTEIVQRFPAPLSESIEARQKLADLARDANDYQDRRRWLEDIVKADAMANVERSERTRTLAARASLELAEPLRDAFIVASLTIPLKDSLKVKKSRMELALAAYGNAAAYGIAEVTTAATYQIANLYYRLSQDLMNSERPAELNAEELEQYDILLEEQAFPLEEQAIDIFASNAKRAADDVYDEWVQRSFERLAELMPGRYAKSERSENLVALLD